MIEGHSYWNMCGAIRDTAGQRLKGSLFVPSQLEADTALLIEHPWSNAGPPPMRCLQSESGFLKNAWRLILKTHDFLPRGAVFFPPAAIQLNLALWQRFGRGCSQHGTRRSEHICPSAVSCTEVCHDLRRSASRWVCRDVGGASHRINQSEERGRILRDWEDNVFGGCPPQIVSGGRTCRCWIDRRPIRVFLSTASYAH